MVLSIMEKRILKSRLNGFLFLIHHVQNSNKNKKLVFNKSNTGIEIKNEQEIIYMWKKFFSSIGIGSVKVDTILYDKKAALGEMIKGDVLICGGQTDEPIQKINLLLYLQYEEVRKDSDFSWHDKHIDELTIVVNRHIKAGEKDRIPFTMKIPADGPKTGEKHKWFLQTTVLINQSVDPTDEDELMIV